ncbi:amidohydrolase family protein [Variovorax sp. DXTD-1]|uniref:amidohydrolase family protein n=1 Tax=Variovorax sp. DXTD-1 TaxID=2495592 RepID=UPI000F8662CB|nr:amidohydrolase family protein [Variovorax sp. DXTD-1]RST45519.1 hypothetical protein EJI00_23560 [Variovorax sp. DXTD-1]
MKISACSRTNGPITATVSNWRLGSFRQWLATTMTATAMLLGGCAGIASLPANRLLVENALVFPMDPARPAPFIGYLLVASDGTIARVGEGRPAADLRAARRIDAQGQWLLPGFVSAHSHLWQSDFAGIASDQNLEGWMAQLYGKVTPGLDAAQLYRLTRLGAEHHLLNGITTAFNFTVTGGDKTGRVDRCQLLAATHSGMRVLHGFNVRKIDAQWTPEDAKERLRAFLQWAGEQRGSGRYLGTVIAGAGMYYDDPAQTRTEAGLMQAFGLDNQQHYLEAPGLVSAERARYRWLKEFGVVGPKLVYGHFVHPTPDMVFEAAQAGAGMSWNPLSNGRLGSGTPDIPAYRAQGLRIGMGVDGEASADRADPFENMRAGLYQIRANRQSASVLSAFDVLRMHTLGSAEVLGVDGVVGSLAEGKKADFLLVDAKGFQPYKDPYAALVFAAGVENINGVFVDGEQVAAQRRLAGVAATPDAAPCDAGKQP